MKILYFPYTHFIRENMEIYLVLTSLLPLVLKKLTSLKNSTIFLGLWKKNTNIEKYFLLVHNLVMIS